MNDGPFIVAARFYSELKARVRSARWIRLKDGVQVCEIRHSFGTSGKERRLILMRKDAGRLPLSTGCQLEIWEDEAIDFLYLYSAYFTSLELPASGISTAIAEMPKTESRNSKTTSAWRASI